MRIHRNCKRKRLLIVNKVYLCNLRLENHKIGCHQKHSRQSTNKSNTNKKCCFSIVIKKLTNDNGRIVGFIQVSFIANDVNSCCLQGNLKEMIFVKASQMKMKMICCLVDEYISVLSYPGIKIYRNIPEPIQDGEL